MSIKEALHNLSITHINNDSNIIFPKTLDTNFTPIILNNKLDGIDRLNSLSHDLQSLENSYDSLQNISSNLNNIIIDLTNHVDSRDLEEIYENTETDIQNTKVYQYPNVPFIPYGDFIPKFSNTINDLKICPRVKNELLESNKTLCSNIEKCEILFKSITEIVSKLNELFAYKDGYSNFSQAFSDNGDGVDEKYGIIIFHLACKIKCGEIKQIEWNENMKKIVNNEQPRPTTGFPIEIENIYRKDYREMISFANKYCLFPSEDNIRKSYSSLVQIIKDLSKNIYLVENHSLNKFDNDFDFEINLLKQMGGPNVNQYIIKKPVRLGRSGAGTCSFKRKINQVINSDPVYLYKAKYLKTSDSFSDTIKARALEKEKFDLKKICLSQNIEIDHQFLRDFYFSFGNIEKYDSNKISKYINFKPNKIKITDETQTLDEFTNSVDTWPYFYSALYKYFEGSFFCDYFEKIYLYLVNSIWMCGNSIESGFINKKFLKFPSLVSFRDAAVLLQLQDQNVSSLSNTLFMDDICFSPLSQMLVLLAIGYFQSKTNPITKEEIYFQEHFTANVNSTITNLIVIKIVDYVLFLANEGLSENNTKNIANLIVEDENTFDDIIPHCFSSVRLIDSNRINMLHRSALIDNDTDIHSNSFWSLNFYINFSINMFSLDTFLKENDLKRNLLQVIKLLHIKHGNNVKKIQPASGIGKKIKKAKSLINKKNLLELCLEINSIDIDTCNVYEYDSKIAKIDENSEYKNITFVEKHVLESYNLNEKILYSNFFDSNNRNQNKKIEKRQKFILSVNKIDTLTPIKIDTQNKLASDFFICHNSINFANFSKLVQSENDLYVVKIHVEVENLLILKSLLDEEYNYKWNLCKTPQTAISAYYTTINRVDNDKIKVDESVSSSESNSNNNILISESEEAFNPETYFQIENADFIFKKHNDLKIYSYYYNINENEFSPVTSDIIRSRFISPKTTFIDIKKATGPDNENNRKMTYSAIFKPLYDLTTDNQSNFSFTQKNDTFETDISENNLDNSLILNITNNSLEKLRNILIKTEKLIIESSQTFILSAKIKLQEQIALMHFLKYPNMYILCKEFSPFYKYFAEIYENNFTIKIEEMNESLKTTRNISDHLQKFKDHYNFLCKKSMPNNKFANILLTNRYLNYMHITALYIIHSQMKHAGIKSYDNLIV
jgi:hypothetical protein